MRGIFGGMFDFNHDGELDAWERACEFDFLDTFEEKTDNDMEEYDEDFDEEDEF